MKNNETSYLRWHLLNALVRGEQVIEMLAATSEDGIGVMARWTLREDGAYDVQAMCTESGQWEDVVDSEEESIPMTPPTVFDDVRAEEGRKLTCAKGAISHALNAICDDVEKFYLMGGRFSGTFSKLAEAHAELHGLDVEKVYETFKPHDLLAYETYCDEREYNKRLLTHCRENGIKVDYEPED